MKNYDELLIYIEKIDNQLELIKKEQHQHNLSLNFKEVDSLISKEQFLKLQILNYLAYCSEDNKEDDKKKNCMLKLHFLQKKYFPKENLK